MCRMVCKVIDYFLVYYDTSLKVSDEANMMMAITAQRSACT